MARGMNLRHLIRGLTIMALIMGVGCGADTVHNGINHPSDIDGASDRVYVDKVLAEYNSWDLYVAVVCDSSTRDYVLWSITDVDDPASAPVIDSNGTAGDDNKGDIATLEDEKTYFGENNFCETRFLINSPSYEYTYGGDNYEVVAEIFDTADQLIDSLALPVSYWKRIGFEADMLEGEYLPSEIYDTAGKFLAGYGSNNSNTYFELASTWTGGKRNDAHSLIYLYGGQDQDKDWWEGEPTYVKEDDIVPKDTLEAMGCYPLWTYNDTLVKQIILLRDKYKSEGSRFPIYLWIFDGLYDSLGNSDTTIAGVTYGGGLYPLPPDQRVTCIFVDAVTRPDTRALALVHEMGHYIGELSDYESHSGACVMNYYIPAYTFCSNCTARMRFRTNQSYTVLSQGQNPNRKGETR